MLVTLLQKQDKFWQNPKNFTDAVSLCPRQGNGFDTPRSKDAGILGSTTKLAVAGLHQQQ